MQENINEQQEFILLLISLIWLDFILTEYLN